MNVELWVVKRRPIWQELEDLLKEIDKSGLASLDREQLQALGRLYRSASSDLSRARSLNLGSDILSYLNNLAVKGHNQVYQSKRNRWLDFFNFLYATFPQLVRQYMGYIAISFLLCVLPGLACYDFTHRDVNFAHMEIMKGQPLVSDQMWDMIEHHKMWTDQLQDASPAFSSMIAANNIRVCIMSFALGITAGFGTAAILFFNGMSVGTVFGVCQHYGLLNNILLFAVGHGSLELPAIFISGGAGLLLGKSILFPGQYRRADSLRLASRPAFGLFAGCIPLLLIAGGIEGFVSPQTELPGEIKIMVGAASFACLLIYLFVPRAPLGMANKG
jgi:uncharacterized membrane protein SpoIIM required for sporulation